MKFVSYDQLAKDIASWSEELPHYDAIVGVPRSGMLPATILALHRNVALSSVDIFADSGRFLQGGFREPRNLVHTILVLDDSRLSGRSLTDARNRLQSLSRKYKIDYGAVYQVDKHESPAVRYFKKVPLPRLFEWNYMHGYWIERSCVDIDGVLCRDPTNEENDDGSNYIDFISSVSPRVIPTKSIHTLVTNRLEKYREHTENWLRKHNIQYDKLIMHPASTKHERMAANDHANRKVLAYQMSKAALFIESSIKQAKIIHAKTKKPVLCTDVKQLYV